MSIWKRVFCSLGCVVFLTLANNAWTEPPNVEVVDAITRLLLEPTGDLAEADKDLLAPGKSDELIEAIRKIQTDVRGARGVEIRIDGNQAQISLEFANRDVIVSCRLSGKQPRLFEIASKVVLVENDNTPITWETLQEEMDKAAASGFEGAILVSRRGKIVLHQGYGMANREQKIPNTKDTIFAIGSAPIDFTHAGILLLKDQGKIALDDPIDKYIKGAPKDKAPITLRYLMTGRSGLPDFHELPTDENPDHSWIGRDEAIRRIMNQRLVFEPGSQRRHSHSAWGLLAAVIEIASGQSYQDFTRTNLFAPAGMNDTGFFGDALAEEKVAIGYGKRSSTPNSPPHWGRTSWLVLGSGGQVSTLSDMYRWEVAMRNGSILSVESSKSYLGDGDGVSQDGDSFGFEFIHSKNPDRIVMLISNAISNREDRRAFDNLGRRLLALVRSKADRD